MGTYSPMENPAALDPGDDVTKTAGGLTIREAYSLCQFLLGREPGTGVSQSLMPMGIFPGI